jgi:cyanophycinase-like exopeptidase
VTARLLVVMGSGETAPTMVKVHRAVVAATGADRPGLVLDTPFGFQLNADDLVARTVAYFADSVGVAVEAAGARTADDLTGRSGDELAARMAAAPFIFSGPGSPTYALRLWRDSLVPGSLADRLTGGGAVVFSSAAALTLGAFTVPVYEIYKAGEPVRWERGLDLMRQVHPDLEVAVVPHYDNAEGGTHDTRFCYLGAPRLARLEAELPDDAFVLGVDEHTALTVDLDAGTATVAGLGSVSVRAAGRTEVLPTGTELAVADLLATASRLRNQTTGLGAVPAGAGRAASGPAAAPVPPGEPPAAPPTGIAPLAAAARQHQQTFAAAADARDAGGMVDAVLALEQELWAWRSDPSQTDDQDRARAVLRALVGRLGQVASVGTRDPATVVGPFVELALEVRAEARAAGRYADADRIRDGLVALGVEVRDSPEGTSWVLAPGSAPS